MDKGRRDKQAARVRSILIAVLEQYYVPFKNRNLVSKGLTFGGGGGNLVSSFV